MADGIELNAGSGGATLATDDIAGIHYQIGKLAFGALDAAVLAVAGAGAVTTGTQRVTLGSDDPAVALLGTIDGDTGSILTAVQLIDDAIFAEDVAAQAADKGISVLAVRRDTASSMVGADNDYTNLIVDANGRLHVIAVGTVDLGATDNAVLDAIAASVAGATPAGTNNIGDVDVLTIAAGDNNIGNVDIASIAAGDNNIGNVDIASAIPAGTNAIGKLAANSGVDIGDVDVTSIAAGANLIGDVSLAPRTSGGLTIHKSIDLDESEEEVKATAGQIYLIVAFNETAAPLFIHLYNLTAANTTVGTSVPVVTLMVPANADSDGAGFVLPIPQGLAFDTAISAACTTGVADNDTGAPGANDCQVLIGFK